MRFENYLESIGYKNIEKMNPSSSIVYRADIGNKTHVIKTDMGKCLQGKFLLSMEKEILEKTKGKINGIPKLENIIELNAPDLINFALIKEYVEGISLNYYPIKSAQSLEGDIIKIVEDLHDLGYCSFDIKPRNFVVNTETKKPFFVDIPDQCLQEFDNRSNSEWENECCGDVEKVKYMMRQLK